MIDVINIMDNNTDMDFIEEDLMNCNYITEADV